MPLTAYLKSSPAQGLFYCSSSKLELRGFCDADWGSCPLTRHSVSGYCVLLGTPSSHGKRRNRSMVYGLWPMPHVNCFGLADFSLTYRCADACCFILRRQRSPRIARNPFFHERTKHTELDCHLVRGHLAFWSFASSLLQNNPRIFLSRLSLVICSVGCLPRSEFHLFPR